MSRYFPSPEHSVTGAAGLQRDAVAHLMADIDIHLVSHTQGQFHSLLPMDLSTHHHAMLELSRQAELRTPLGDLQVRDTKHQTPTLALCTRMPFSVSKETTMLFSLI